MTDYLVDGPPPPCCTSEPCISCGWCEGCDRFVGTPHLDNCACPDPVSAHSSLLICFVCEEQIANEGDH